MIYLRTGGNGSGKTLFTLYDVRQQQLKENRPVYYSGFTALQAINDFGWQPFDPKDWQSLPDGSICVMDECQEQFPARKSGDTPSYIAAMAVHRRKRGFDFWMITPHPMFIDIDIRRLIDTPSWHQHLKRAPAGDMSSVLEWRKPNIKCEEPGSGDSGVVTMRAFPKEVYSWYKSASLHTGKSKIPFRVWVLLACAVIAPLCGYYAYSKFTGGMTARDANLSRLAGKEPAVTPGATQPQLHRPGEPTPERRVLTRAEYAASFEPRIAGLPSTAPRYDELDRPAQAPKPAACLDGTKPGAKVRTCTCWTQQATVMQIAVDVCRQIAAGGFFDDTLQPARAIEHSRPLQAPQALASTPELSSPLVIASTPALPPPDAASTVQRDGEVLKQMRKRNYIQ